MTIYDQLNSLASRVLDVNVEKVRADMLPRSMTIWQLFVRKTGYSYGMDFTIDDIVQMRGKIASDQDLDEVQSLVEQLAVQYCEETAAMYRRIDRLQNNKGFNFVDSYLYDLAENLVKMNLNPTQMTLEILLHLSEMIEPGRGGFLRDIEEAVLPPNPPRLINNQNLKATG